MNSETVQLFDLKHISFNKEKQLKVKLSLSNVYVL